MLTRPSTAAATVYPTLEALLAAVRACRVCEAHLPLGPRPVLRAGATARILVVGQAPGVRVHRTGVPWDDPSGERLRAWMGVDRDVFYDESRIAIIPMGYCYPGRGNGGESPQVVAGRNSQGLAGVRSRCELNSSCCEYRRCRIPSPRPSRGDQESSVTLGSLPFVIYHAPSRH